MTPAFGGTTKKLLSKAEFAGKADYKGKKLFLGIANTMNPGMDIVKVKRDTSLQTKHIRSILTLNNLLQKNKQNGMAYNYKYYSGDTHESVPLNCYL